MRIDEYKWKFNQDLTIGDKMSMELKQAQLFDDFEFEGTGLYEWFEQFNQELKIIAVLKANFKINRQFIIRVALFSIT